MTKRLSILSILLLLLLPVLCWGQYTSVSGTVTDPTGIPYANGTVNASLTAITTGPPVFTGTNVRVDSNTFATVTDSTGAFTLRVPDNNQITPSGTQWKFNVCAPGMQLNPLNPTIPLTPFQTCFNSSITITGASQSITTTLNAAAAAFAPLKVVGLQYGDNTVQKSIPTDQVVYTFRSLSGAASISATNTVSNVGFGFYKICASLYVTATGTGTVTASLNINNGTAAISAIAFVSSLSLTALTNPPTQACAVYAINTNNSNPLQWLTTYAATGSYGVDVAVIKLN